MRNPRSGVSRRLGLLRSLPARDRCLVLWAAGARALLWLGLRYLPFPVVRAGFRRALAGGRRSASGGYSRERMAELLECSRSLVPIRSDCLPSALAGQWLLARAGYASEVRIGVCRQPNHLLAAHAWLVADGEVLVGSLPDLDRFRTLTSSRSAMR